MNSVNVVVSDQLPMDTIALCTGLRSIPSMTTHSIKNRFAVSVIYQASSIVTLTGVSSLQDKKPGTGKRSLTGGTGCR